METWTEGAVSSDAIDDFRDADDPETSLWTDDGERRGDVVLALAFNKKSIGSFAFAMLWQDDGAIGDDLGMRIIQSKGETPYVPARSLHYHVSQPQEADYERLVLAAAHRGDIPTVRSEDLRNLIEDAYLAGTLPVGLEPEMQEEIDDLIGRRFVCADAVNGGSVEPIFDLRDPSAASQKIANAEFVSGAELEKVLMKKRIGKRTSFVMYCGDGAASLSVARELWKKQKSVRVLVGGFAEWTRLGFPVEAC